MDLTIILLYTELGIRDFLLIQYQKPAYNGFLKIKNENLEHVKFLVKYIENEENREFYKVLDELSEKPQEEGSSDAERYE